MKGLMSTNELITASAYSLPLAVNTTISKYMLISCIKLNRPGLFMNLMDVKGYVLSRGLVYVIS